MSRAALTLAGFDPTGGAGLSADLAVFHHLGVPGLAAVTALTVQNSGGVQQVQAVDPTLLVDQATAALEDRPVGAIKVGMLATAANAQAVGRLLGGAARGLPLVVDPVMGASRGRDLSPATAALRTALRDLLPHTTLITPNLAEAQVLTGHPVTTLDEMEQAARTLRDWGAHAVLVKGGHLDQAPVDLLWDGEELIPLAGRRVPGEIHGTGCHLSAAITAHLARGAALTSAVRKAHAFLQDLLPKARRVGHGDLHYLAPDLFVSGDHSPGLGPPTPRAAVRGRRSGCTCGGT